MTASKPHLIAAIELATKIDSAAAVIANDALASVCTFPPQLRKLVLDAAVRRIVKAMDAAKALKNSRLLEEAQVRKAAKQAAALHAQAQLAVAAERRSFARLFVEVARARLPGDQFVALHKEASDRRSVIVQAGGPPEPHPPRPDADG